MPSTCQTSHVVSAEEHQKRQLVLEHNKGKCGLDTLESKPTGTIIQLHSEKQPVPKGFFMNILMSLLTMHSFFYRIICMLCVYHCV